MQPWFVAVAVFVGVTALIGGCTLLMREKPNNRIEDRLDLLTGVNTPTAAKEGLLKQGTLLAETLEAQPGLLQTFLERFGNIGRLFEQADVSLTVGQLLGISGLLAACGIGVGLFAHLHPALLLSVALALAFLPIVWLLMRRRRRLRALAAALPEAMEMLSRALRAGQSLGSGFSLVATEVSGPLGREFGRVFDEQNLGIPLEESLQAMSDRIPNLDVKFFATAVILQRQTGGDLAEILDKIGTLIRERFKIWGQIQALTGEGRLSGVVLLALPVLLFVAVYKLNPEYLSVLFTDPMGKKLLAGAIVMQVFGALMIRKIVDIKVQPVTFAVSELFNFTDVLPLALFGMVAAVVWWVLELVATRRPRALERLDELRNPRARRAIGEDVAAKRTDAMSKVLEMATPALARPLEPKSEAEIGKLKARLTAAGFRAENAGSVFLGLKFVGLVGGLILGTGSVLPLTGLTQKGLMWAVAIAGVLFYLPDFSLAFIASKRKQSIFLGLPDALDLIIVCVEAGLGLDQAMRKVADEMKRTYPVLAEEFAVSNFQLQMGRPKNQVLHELGARTGVKDLRTLAAVIIQADKFGSSVAQALRVQSESMRTRRRQIAEEKAAKTAVKLIFPLVLFIFPGIFVVLVGPAAITMVRQMFPAMGGG